MTLEEELTRSGTKDELERHALRSSVEPLRRELLRALLAYRRLVP